MNRRETTLPCTWRHSLPALLAALAHREASEALLRAEAAACVGVAPEDRDVSPFRHREDIASASPLPRPDTSQGAPALRGAVLVFRPVPGLSTARLQRVIDCHLARNASLGPSAMPEMSYCPLAVAGAGATVSSAGDQLAVAVVSDDPAAAQEILRRARLLSAPGR
jgi:hypothetical protein